jgi:ParB-like chromosome segregation protein Spo0J
VQELLMTGKLDMGHARALLPLNGAQQVAVAQRVVQHGLSVREAERLVQQIIQPPAGSRAAVDRDLLRLQEEISDRLGALSPFAAARRVLARSPSNSATWISWREFSEDCAKSLTGYDIYGKTPSFH